MSTTHVINASDLRYEATTPADLVREGPTGHVNERYVEPESCDCKNATPPALVETPWNPHVSIELPPTFQRAFQALHDECLLVMVDRQKKYGPTNIPAFGTLGTLVRLNDKVERLKTLRANGRLENGDFPDESVEDTLIDIANYANIMRAQLRGWWTKDYCPALEGE